MKEKAQPSHLEVENWRDYKTLVNESVCQIEAYLAEPTMEKNQCLRDLLSNVQNVNNQYKNHAWGPVRIIQSTDVLLIEKALYGILRPSESSHWGYQIARDYAERYNPRYGNGLIPESAVLVEDIANFWCQYHFGLPLDKWINKSKKHS
ncbi:MAG: hypothetical protein ACFB2W_12205 [Leptolyngbyaceae cyanobacterium]